MKDELLEKFSYKLDNLKMTLSDWMELSSKISSKEYRKILVDYQNRKYPTLP